MDKIHSCIGEIDSLLHIVDKIYLTLRIRSVYIGKLDCGSTVATIEEDGQTGGRDHGRDERFVELDDVSVWCGR